MSRLTEIENFVEIINAGSLSEASRRTGLALSAVSRRLKELEKRLGVTLVRRSTRKISLTEAGHDFFLQCQQIINDLNDAESSLSETTHRLEGRIRLAAPTSFTCRHLGPILTEFLRLYPDVALELETNDRRVDIIQDGFDLALRIGRLQDSSLRARRLTRIRHLPVASKILLDRLGLPERPEDIGRYSVLQYRSSRQSNRWSFARPDGSRGAVHIKNRIICNNGEFLTRCAEDGLGVAIEPTFIVSSAIAEGRLVPLFSDHVWSDDAAYVVYPEARVLPLRVRALIDHIADRFPSEPSWDREIARNYPLYQAGWS
jgi:DNA-binding transcriptional LysR family regulator